MFANVDNFFVRLCTAGKAVLAQIFTQFSGVVKYNSYYIWNVVFLSIYLNMEKQQIVYENLVTAQVYSELYHVTTKTVYDWIKQGKLTHISFLGKNWVDKTVPAPKSYKNKTLAA